MTADDVTGLHKKVKQCLSKTLVFNLTIGVHGDEVDYTKQLVAKMEDNMARCDVAVFLGHFSDELNTVVADDTVFEQSPDTLSVMMINLESAHIHVDRAILTNLALVHQSNVLIHRQETDLFARTMTCNTVLGSFSIGDLPEEDREETQTKVLSTLVADALSSPHGGPTICALTEVVPIADVISRALREDHFPKLHIITHPDEYDDNTIVDTVQALRYPCHPLCCPLKASMHTKGSAELADPPTYAT